MLDAFGLGNFEFGCSLFGNFELGLYRKGIAQSLGGSHANIIRWAEWHTVRGGAAASRPADRDASAIRGPDGGAPPFAWRPHAAVFDIGCCRLGVECLMLDAGCCKLGRRGCFKIWVLPDVLALPTYFKLAK